MMRIKKLLALATVAVVAVACNGIAPTSPTATVASSDEATALVGATASSDPIPVPIPGCRNITEVKLQTLGSTGDIKVQAVYLHRGLPIKCNVAPDWSSRGRGRLASTRDPFTVTVTLGRPPTSFEVTAQAPNGVRDSILFP